jgi:hypothetical protein
MRFPDRLRLRATGFFIKNSDLVMRSHRDFCKRAKSICIFDPLGGDRPTWEMQKAWP